jgi:hypothetical protein
LNSNSNFILSILAILAPWVFVDNAPLVYFVLVSKFTLDGLTCGQLVQVNVVFVSVCVPNLECAILVAGSYTSSRKIKHVSPIDLHTLPYQRREL